MRQMFSSWRPWAWRSRPAACAASGKQTCSGQTAWVRIERLTFRSFSYWKVRYCVGGGCQGGKIRLGGGEQFLDVLAKFELVILHAQQVAGNRRNSLHNISGKNRRNRRGLGESTRLMSPHPNQPHYKLSTFDMFFAAFRSFRKRGRGQRVEVRCAIC